MRHITCVVLNHQLLMKIVPIFAGTGSGLHCPKILISTYASRVKFHKSSFWVLILAAGGPYWVSISQKNGSLLGPYLKAWGSLIVLGTVERWPDLTNNCNLLFYEFFLQADQSGEGSDSDSPQRRFSAKCNHHCGWVEKAVCWLQAFKF